MAIEIHDSCAIAALRRAGASAAATLAHVGARLTAGISTAQVDAWVREDTARRGGRPSQLGYHGFPAAVCVSPNDVVCHGVPSPKVVLRDGDIVNVDVTTMLGGYHGDTSMTFAIGTIEPAKAALLDATKAALQAGIDAVRPGVRLGDIGAAIEASARAAGYDVVREYCGHGIGREMHLPPQVCHYGRAGTGLRLRAGMAFTIEPMLTLGRQALVHDDDGWTVRTADGSPSAQAEHTVLVTADGVEVLTRLP